MRSNLLAKALSMPLALAIALAGGCKQRTFLTEADYNRTHTTLLAEGAEHRPDLSSQALTQNVKAPPTLHHLDRKVRFLSLSEAVAIALEQGRVGQPSLLFPGTAQDNLVSGSAGGLSGSDAIRVLALGPASVGTAIEASLSKFDAVFTSSIQWQHIDQPIGTSLQTFQAGQQNSINTQNGTFNSAFVKPLASGGATALVFNIPYTFTNLPSRVNPAYQPSLQFQFEQPLLQGFGVEINQLRQQHPGSLLNPGVIGNNPTGNGILIARIGFDQSRADFERNVNQMLLNVENAYWNLYGSYWTVYSREQGLRSAFEAFRVAKARFEAGRISAADFHQTRSQYELFRAQRLTAIDQLLENERQLRALLGVPVEDGCRLMPSDSPTLAPYIPDWDSALCEAKSRRPELFLVRQQIKINQLQVRLAMNSLLPDLRFATTYDFNSLGNRIDGPAGNPAETNAFRTLADGNFSTWTAQIRLTVPLGFRFAHTQVRQAQLQLASSLETLKEQEEKVESFLALQYRRLVNTYEQIAANRAQREAFAELYRARREEVNAGRGTSESLAEAGRFLADALNSEYQAVKDYNNALAGFEFAKGTILQHNNVVISEGPLPQCAQVRAVEHERQRTASLVLLERANPIDPALGKPEPMVPGKAVSLPAALSAVPPIKDAPVLPVLPNGSALSAPTEANLSEVFPDVPAPLTKVPTNSVPANKPANLPLPATINAPMPVPGKPASEFGTARTLKERLTIPFMK